MVKCFSILFWVPWCKYKVCCKHVQKTSCWNCNPASCWKWKAHRGWSSARSPLVLSTGFLLLDWFRIFETCQNYDAITLWMYDMVRSHKVCSCFIWKNLHKCVCIHWYQDFAWVCMNRVVKRIVIHCIVIYCIVFYCIVLYCMVVYGLAALHHCLGMDCIALSCVVLSCVVTSFAFLSLSL